MSDARPAMPTNFRWISCCSAHMQYEAECDQCNAGHWSYPETEQVTSWLWEYSQKIWRLWANDPHTPEHLTKIFPNLISHRDARIATLEESVAFKDTTIAAQSARIVELQKALRGLLDTASEAGEYISIEESPLCSGMLSELKSKIAVARQILEAKGR